MQLRKIWELGAKRIFLLVLISQAFKNEILNID
jgi:hypothetical protein